MRGESVATCSEECAVSVEEKITFCRLCEQLCGLTVSVDDGVATRIRADRDHPVTHGFACPKGLSINEIQYDPDRVITPLRRNAAGGFEPVSWDTAYAEIGKRLRAVITRSGSDSIGMYLGNPAAFNLAHTAWAKGMMDALNSRHFYSSASQDTNSRMVASHFLYGSPLAIPVPDLPRTDFLLMVGANPLVSHGSLISGGLIRTDLIEVVQRGGRVVVVDPRRTETAQRFEHVPVLPDGDAWLLMAMLNVIFAEGLTAPFAERGSRGTNMLRQAVEPATPEAAEQHSGVPAATVLSLARDFATADRAAAYGRVGACVGSNGTVVNFLLDALNVVTGNLDRPGGSIFPSPPIDLLGVAAKNGMAGYGTKHTRIGNYPDVIGMMPAGVMVEEITTPGQGQLRALIVTAGNPVLSVPNGRALKTAIEQLDLMVSIDLYINETNSEADYILPATTFLEREDVNWFVQPYQYRPFVQWTEAVVPVRGEARNEWTIFRDICKQIGVVPSSVASVRRLGRLAHYVVRPRSLFDAALRLGSFGDRFGLRRGGLSRRRLLANPRGIVLGDESCHPRAEQGRQSPDRRGRPGARTDPR
jgi:anaerobic selenocysteine-containing dehydrogenase